MKTVNSEAVEGVVVDDNPTFKKTAVKAIKKGSLAAKQAAVGVTVSPVKLINQSIYRVCYGLAYGAVYGALIVGNTFPANSTVRKGLHEGLESAVKDFDAQHREAAVSIDSEPANA